MSSAILLPCAAVSFVEFISAESETMKVADDTSRHPSATLRVQWALAQRVRMARELPGGVGLREGA